MVYCCVIPDVAGHNALAIGHYNHYFTGEGNLADHLLVLCEAFILAARDLSV